MNTYIHTCVHVCIHKCMHKCAHTYMCIHTCYTETIAVLQNDSTLVFTPSHSLSPLCRIVLLARFFFVAAASPHCHFLRSSSWTYCPFPPKSEPQWREIRWLESFKDRVWLTLGRSDSQGDRLGETPDFGLREIVLARLQTLDLFCSKLGV